MKTMNMKTIRVNMIKVSLLVIFTSLLPLANASAQSSNPTPVYTVSGAPIEVGDSIMVNKDSTRYETGERIAKWVYNNVYIVRQVNSKYHPNSVLVRGIYSWIPAGAAVPMNESKKYAPIVEPEPAPVVEPEPIVEPEPTPEPVVVEEPVDTTAKVVEHKPQPYQVNRFSVGVRGAFASSMAKPATTPLGFDVLLDLQYAHYWAADQDKIRLGIMTGLSAGYMSTTRSQAWDETYVAKTDDGDIEYHVTADNIQETNHQLQLEVPLMFSLITAKGLFFNVGPRFLLPAYTPYKQVITNGNVVATDLQTGVVIPNNPVYGQLSEEQVNQKGKGEQQFDLTMTLGFELGYEFKLKSGNSIGLGAFLNYGVYSMYSNKALGSAIDVTAPSKQADQNAVVNVESLTNAYTEKMGHLDAGVKVSFNLDFVK